MKPSRRPFLALALAETFSLIGTRLSMIAIPWLVLTTTHDPFLTGVVAFAEMLPYVAAKALSGPFIDRLGARNISIYCDLASMIAIALVPLLHFMDALSIFVLLPLIVIFGILRGPAEAAKLAMVPAVAVEANLPLERVSGVTGTIERLASTIGAALAGGLVALFGAAPALLLNVGTLVISALIIARGIKSSDSDPEPETQEPQSYWHDLAVGWNFLRGDAVLVGVLFMVSITNFLDQAMFGVMLPFWTQSSGHNAVIFGLLVGCFSGFSVLGSILATAFAEKLPRLVIFTAAFLITGFPRFLILILDVPLVSILTVIGVAGFAAGFLNPILSAVIFERAPKPLVGRISSLMAALCFSLMPLGGLAAGAMIVVFGLKVTLAAAGIIYFVATMLPLTLKSFRAFADRPVPET